MMTFPSTSSSSLDSLPIELIEEVVNNVSAKTLWTSIRLLNRTFYADVSSRDYWLRRIKNVNNIELPPRIRKQQDLLSLVKLSLLTEENLQRFGENDCLTDNFACTRHIATPDAFHSRIIDGRRMLFTGARDYKIVIWDLQKAATERSLQNGMKFEIPNAHNGWIWSITSFDEHSFYSSSWDNNIKCWRYGESAVMEACYNAHRAVLGLAAVDNTIIGSVYGGHLHFCDFRQPDQLITNLNLKCSTAVGIYADPKGYGLVTGTEKGSVLLIDRRKLDKPVKKYKMDDLRTLGYSDGVQISASSRNRVVIFDPSTLDVELDFTEATGTSPYYCIPTESGYFCAQDFAINYYSGGQNPDLIAHATYSSRISNLKYFDGDLVAGLGEGSIQVCLKEQMNNGRLRSNSPDQNDASN